METNEMQEWLDQDRTIDTKSVSGLVRQVNEQAAQLAAANDRIRELEERFQDVIMNLEDLKLRPSDMMILGTALSIARNYKKVLK